MTRFSWIVAGVAILLSGGFGAAWLVQGPNVPERDFANLTGDVNRGAYVARLSGCIACHTHPKGGTGVLAGGAAIETEFGTFFAPNITPHAIDGIGSWTLADFSRSLTAGTNPKGDHYFPAFPYTFYAKLTDQDVADLWAAVRSVPPVEGGPPPHDLKFPFGWRGAVGAWKRLFAETGQIDVLTDKSDAWNRGRYLAEAAAHCGACHTPRNLLGGRDPARKYQGGVGPGDEQIPAITPTALTRAKWDKDALRYALRSGITPSGDVFGGSMAEVVRDGTRFWSDADIEAIVEYVMAPESTE
jgi:mono/diheme cytochrome c family protein